MQMCAVLVHTVKEGYFEGGLVFDRETGQINGNTVLLPGAGKGRRRKPSIYLSLCPFCGGKQKLDGPFQEQGPECVGPTVGLTVQGLTT